MSAGAVFGRLGKRVSYAKTGGPILTICTLFDVFCPKPWFHVKIKHKNILKFFKVILFISFHDRATPEINKKIRTVDRWRLGSEIL